MISADIDDQSLPFAPQAARIPMGTRGMMLTSRSGSAQKSGHGWEWGHGCWIPLPSGLHLGAGRLRSLPTQSFKFSSSFDTLN